MTAFWIILGILLGIGFIALIAWSASQAPKWQQTRNDRLGKYGELLVQRELGADIAGVNRVLNNYRFFSDGKVREIDHIVISERGLFVIETKNWSGDIFGSDDDARWTQVLGNGDIVHEHENPVKQNSGHIYHLKNVLKHVLPQRLWLNSLVVFVQNNVEHVNSSFVVSLSELRATLESFPARQLSSASIEQIYRALLAEQRDDAA